MRINRLLNLSCVLWALLLCALWHTQAAGQELPPVQPASERAPKTQLKVGLVLSGGGARGIAHVGVLEWFEQHRIPVDYVAGTSMGGLVGAIYAMGTPPAEMRALLKAIKWAEMLSSGPSYEQLAYRRKEDRHSFQTSFDLGLRHGARLPLGLSSAHYIGLLFDRLTLPYAGIASFDELPIPYRCVATDFLKAQPVVLKDGSLSNAMRATMSIPGVFPPVERDGAVLVDGGLLNNIPTDVMRGLRPDVVVAIDVGTSLGELQDIASLAGILSQSIGVMTIDNDRRNLRLADIIIAPELGDQSLLDFSEIDKLADLGYRAAEQKAAILEKFALTENQWVEYLARRRARRLTDVVIPEAVEIVGVSERAQASLRKELAGHAGRPLAPPALEADLTRITGQGRYESLDYELAPSKLSPNLDVLLIRVKEKPHAPPTLNFGLEIDGSKINDINFTIGARLTFYDIGKAGSEWRNDVKLGFNNLLATEYYLPLGGRGFFAAPLAAYDRKRTDIFQGEARVGEYQVERFGGGLDLGFTERRQEWRVGYTIGHLNAEVRTGSPLLPALSGTFSQARVRWRFDGQDSATVPTRGLRIATEGRWFFQSPGARGSFPQAEIRASLFKPLSPRGSLFVVGSGGTSFGQATAPEWQFTLGGPFRLGAYNRDELRGDNYVLTSGGYLHRISQLPPLLGGKVYLGGWYEFGGAYRGTNANTTTNRFRSAVSGGLILDTVLGPFSVVGNWGEGGRGKIYFTFGKLF